MVLMCSVSSAQNYRSYDGRDNNIENPDWGATHSELMRLTPADYADGISIPKLDMQYNKPNPRVISNELFAQSEIISDRLALSDFTWVFGQFIDHDISLSDNDPTEILDNIIVPENDEFFPAGMSIVMARTEAMPGTGTSTDNPRQHANLITAFLDASAVYGSDEARAQWLRSYEDGKLKVSEGNLLPWNTESGKFNDVLDAAAPLMADDTHALDKYFVAGDIRANENPLLLTFHTIFVREHNRLCDELKASHPDWTDELLYQRARKIVGGYIQQITFEEWLPAMGITMPEYSGYNPSVNPSISNEFSAAAFRLGHTLINSNIIRMNNDGEEMAGGTMTLKDAFFNPQVILMSGGIDPFLKGMATQVQQEMDCKVINDVRNFLFGAPGAGGLDLAAININRGRERGIPTYNEIRQYLGLPPINSFYTLTGDVQVAQQMEEVYGSIDHLDAWVGMVSESHVSNDALFGELMMKIVERQFQSIRDGDRFYFEIDPLLTESQKNDIRNIKFRDIIMRNTQITLMQDEVFRAMPHEMINIGPEIIEFNLDAAVYPNPTLGDATLKLYSDIEQEITVSILDYQGSQVSNRTVHAYQGENFFDMTLPDNMPRGLYNVMLSTSTGYNILKIIKE